MKTFETFKDYIVKNAKKNNACAIEYKKALQSTNYQELLKVITNNLNWCHSKELINAEILSNVPKDELLNANIYVNEVGVIQKDGLYHYFNSTSKHYDSSTSKHYDSSTSKHYGSSTSKHYDSSTSKHYDSSTSEHYDSSTSEHYDSSTSKHYDSSTSEHYGSSTSKHYDSSTSEHYGSSTSKHYDSSTSKHYFNSTSEHYNSSTSEHYDSSYSSVYELNNRILNDKVIIRERSTGNVYCKKDAFNIIQL